MAKKKETVALPPQADESVAMFVNELRAQRNTAMDMAAEMAAKLSVANRKLAALVESRPAVERTVIRGGKGLVSKVVDLRPPNARRRGKQESPRSMPPLQKQEGVTE